MTPVWIDFDGTHVRFNTARGPGEGQEPAAQSDGGARPSRIRTIPYRYVQVRGRVAEVTETGADAHIDALAKKYLGQDKYPYRKPGEVRVT